MSGSTCCWVQYFRLMEGLSPTHSSYASLSFFGGVFYFLFFKVSFLCGIALTFGIRAFFDVSMHTSWFVMAICHDG